ncbi:uncharacterized protein DUF4174 [Rhodovulum bhavnagarense]|uniref:Uncharacterized protein DUF4174 n=1 Tax=Rhodovulum bhavnagarense TaxID=992286 RepID=A0A4R2RJP8_9RHOB|nr:DUF4174 domain-containing protein [Rhodovulum bhavnagarense]TCP62978.1 uncharacterized protein DUF4174 [Rhodovulum bhavnagarense]
MNSRLASLAIAALAAISPRAQAAEEATPLARWQADPTVVLEAQDIAIEDFHWLARPVVVFADSPADPRYRQQMALLTERIDDLALRDVVVIVDTDPSAPSALRTGLRPRGFMLVLIGKDGDVRLRKPFPWDVRELSRSIDKMPLRQQEIRDRR